MNATPDQNIEQQIFSDDYLSELDPVSRAVAEKRLEALISKQVSEARLDSHKVIVLTDLEARIDELTWYLGYNHKYLPEKVWKRTTDRIAELKQTPPTPNGDEQGGLAKSKEAKSE